MRNDQVKSSIPSSGIFEAPNGGGITSKIYVGRRGHHRSDEELPGTPRDRATLAIFRCRYFFAPFYLELLLILILLFRLRTLVFWADLLTGQKRVLGYSGCAADARRTPGLGQAEGS